MPKALSNQAVTWALVFGACCIGLAPIMVKLAPAPPTLSAAWRLAIASPILLVWAFMEWRANPIKLDRKDIIGMLLAGLWFGLDLLTWHAGIVRTSAANATFFANLTPVLLMLGGLVAYYIWPKLGAIFPSQAISPIRIGLVFIAILGAFMMSRGAVHVTARATLGDWLSMLTALWYALYLAQVGQLRVKLGTGMIMAASSVFGAVLLWSYVLVQGGALLPNPANFMGFLPLLTLGIVCHCMGQGTLAYALGRIETGLAAIIILCQPVMAGLVGFWALGEHLGPYQLLGGALVLLAVARARLEAVKA